MAREVRTPPLGTGSTAPAPTADEGLEGMAGLAVRRAASQAALTPPKSTHRSGGALRAKSTEITVDQYDDLLGGAGGRGLFDVTLELSRPGTQQSSGSRGPPLITQLWSKSGQSARRTSRQRTERGLLPVRSARSVAAENAAPSTRMDQISKKIRHSKREEKHKGRGPRQVASTVPEAAQHDGESGSQKLWSAGTKPRWLDNRASNWVQSDMHRMVCISPSLISRFGL